MKVKTKKEKLLVGVLKGGAIVKTKPPKRVINFSKFSGHPCPCR